MVTARWNETHLGFVAHKSRIGLCGGCFFWLVQMDMGGAACSHSLTCLHLWSSPTGVVCRPVLPQASLTNVQTTVQPLLPEQVVWTLGRRVGWRMDAVEKVILLMPPRISSVWMSRQIHSHTLFILTAAPVPVSPVLHSQSGIYRVLTCRRKSSVRCR